MKFEISRALLETTLSNVSKGLSVKTPMPILTGIYVSVEEDRVVFITSNREIAVRIVLEQSNDLVIHKTGSCVIPGKYFVDIVKKIESNTVEVITFTEKSVKVLAGKSDFTLNIFEKEQFPITNFDIDVDPIKLTCKELKQLVRQTSVACSTDEAGKTLRSLNFYLKDGELITVATDSFRLAKKVTAVETVRNELKLNIPCKSLEEFCKIIEDSNDLVSIYVTNNLAVLKVKNISFHTRLGENNFPRTTNFFYNTNSIKIVVNKNSLIAAVDRVSLFTLSTNSYYINIILNENSQNIELISNATEIGKAQETVETIKISEKVNFQMFLSAKFLLDALKTFDSENIEITFNGEIRPATITAENSTDLVQVLLPIRAYN